MRDDTLAAFPVIDATPKSLKTQLEEAGARFIATSGYPPPIPWFAPHWILEGDSTLLAGFGGAGKSILALQLQASTAIGKPWLGLDVPECPSLGFYSEDSMEAVANRLDAIAISLGTTVEKLVNAGMNVLPKPDGNLSLVTFDRNGTAATTDVWAELREMVRDTRTKLLVLDNLADFLPVLAFDNTAIRRARRCALDPLCKDSLTILGLQNVTLAGLRAQDEAEGSSGGLAWRDAFRGRMYMRRPAGDGDEKSPENRRELAQVKSNNAAEGLVIPLEWRDGLWVRTDQPNGGMVGTIDKTLKERAEAFLTCLREVRASGRHASHTVSSRDAYAPKLFRTVPAGRSYAMKDLRGAMERLFGAGKIRVESGRTTGRNYGQFIAEVAA
jgi:RecA-family ATPase